MALFDEILSDAPIGYWRSSIGVDFSGNGVTLAPFHSPTDGTSLDLSAPTNPSIELFGTEHTPDGGDNLYDAVGYLAFNLTTAVSLSFLMQPSAVGGVIYDTVRKGSLYGVYLGTDSKAHAVVTIGGVVTNVAGATTIVVDTTYHVGMSFDGTTLKLYINGALDGSVAVSGSIDVTATVFTIGTASAPVNGFQGFLDEIALFDTVLDVSRFDAHWDASRVPAPEAAPELAPLHSGGTGNTTGLASLGGNPGGALTENVGVLFGGITNAERFTGYIDYRCIYLQAPENVTDIVVWIAAPSSETDVAEAIAEDVANPAQTIAGPTVPPQNFLFAPLVFSEPTDYASGLTLGDLTSGTSVPLWIRRTIDPDAAAGERSMTLGITWLDPDLEVVSMTLDVVYALQVPVTLYVNAEHPAKDDTRLRAAAGDDPALPYATIAAAMWQVLPGDTIQVEPSVNANLADPYDTSVYLGLQEGIPPAADSSSSEDPTRLIGNIVGDVRPKYRHMNLSHFHNWHFEGFQAGYDRGSGHDNMTIGSWSFNYDITFRNVVWTGGCYWARGFGGLFWMDQCVGHHPWGGSTHYLDGAFLWCWALDSGVASGVPATFRATSCRFEDVTGEDVLEFSSFDTFDNIEIGYNSDTGEILGNEFVDIPQIHPIAHVDCIQCFGCGGNITIVGNYFRNCATPIIFSDYQFPGRVIIAKNVIGEGCVWAMQFQGCDNLWIIHNTMRTIWQLRIYTRELGVSQHLVIVNNSLDEFAFGATDIDPASIVVNNISARQPEFYTPWGVQIDGVPEYGTTARLTAADLTAAYEQATGSPAIGAGHDLSGLGLTAEELALFDDDFLGRPFASPRDVGALQSDPLNLPDPEPRPPYVSNWGPTGTAALDVSATAELYAVPGQEISAATVTSASAYIIDDVTGTHLLAVVTLADPDENGRQLVTIDPVSDLDPLTDGTLWPRVAYTVVLTSAILDTEGSALIATAWSFRSGGPVGPAVGEPDAFLDPTMTFARGEEAGAMVRRIADAIEAAASPLPDANPTGGEVVLALETDQTTGQRTVALSGGSLNGTHRVIV